MIQGKFTLPYSYMFKGREDINYQDPAVPDAIKYEWVEFHKWKMLFQWYAPVGKTWYSVLQPTYLSLVPTTKPLAIHHSNGLS